VFDVDGNAGLRVVGTSGNDAITITDDPVTDQPLITGAGTVPNLGTSEILFYDIVTNGGTDAVAFTTSGDYDGDIRSVSADLGSGTDSFSFQVADNIANGSAVNLEVFGSTGNDSLAVQVDGVLGGSTFDALLDGGNDSDSLDVDTGNVLDGSSVGASLYLGSGTNAANTNLEHASDASRVEYFIRGENGTDTVTNNIDGNLDGFLALNSFLGSGADVQLVNLGGGFDVEADATALLNLNGGGGNDQMIVQYDDTASLFRIEGTLDVNMQGGAGNDFIVFDLFSGTLETQVNGTLRLRVAGQTGHDNVQMGFIFDDLSVGRADLRVTCGSGNDSFFALVGDNSLGGITYVGGFMLVDGGSGVDARAIGTAGVPVQLLRFDSILT
jgi:hypothetical protein